ncbi:MAG TPA: 3-phosphoserine/phosphohydroxythreonine transaminase [Candidatus Hydrogenedentes bacterium]|nr:3-phosphoserine/phosphohydroxythreonine transaminase [Candidatus Hydrogenedentota bacterium]
MEKRIFNFSAGPAVLPEPVLKKAQEEMLVYPGAGASVMEISHRSKTFAAILEKTKADMKALLGVPDNYSILFTPGGATLQFSMLAMNFLNGASADYIMSGSWASKASGEAKKHGTVRPIWSGKEENYIRMPKKGEYAVDPNAAYLHFTSNETIQGIEFVDEPEAGNVPLICDASSDFMSHPIPVEKYAMIYAGAQKNVGPSGTAVVILRNDMLERVPQNLPSLLDYKLMVENDSLYNTPSSFSVYIIGLVMKWLLEEVGGLDKIAAINKDKAQLLYDVIDNSGGFYKGHAQKDSRSLMNVTFRLPDEAAEKEFIAQATAAGLDGLKGHRSVGGCRASIYNAMPVEGCKALQEFMLEFQKKKG